MMSANDGTEWCASDLQNVALDHYHYDRQMRFHVSDFCSGGKLSYHLMRNFSNAACYTENNTQVIYISPQSSSRTAECNAEGGGGVIGITENETSLRRWMVSVSLFLPPVACQSNRSFPMRGTADGDAISRCQVLCRAGIVQHGANQ